MGCFVVSQEVFDQFRQQIQTLGTEAAIDQMIEYFRQEKQHFQLFEMFKLRARARLGLPLLFPGVAEDLTEDQRNQLEDALVEACDEVGRMLLDEGQIREGWYYLRPVGDKTPVIDALQQVEVDEENLEDLIEVALYEGVAPEIGFRWMLEHYGTCNAVTTYEQQLAGMPPVAQQPLAGLLLDHVYDELRGTVSADIAQQEGSEPQEKSLSEMIASRDWLFANSAYHIDTSHLAAAVRFARVLRDEAHLRKALELVDYGSRLDPAFQYEQTPPFTELYPSHKVYFLILLNEDTEAGLAYFRDKAEASDIRREGSLAIETYIELLSRLGRHDEALDVALKMIPAGVHTIGVAPSLIELSQNANDFERLAQFSQEQGDMLGYATALLFAKRSEEA
ncbi:hypothetical protein C5Y97_11935 [Blastopirellula marina]|uniref:Uncharacterized protein n=1 Tax=Blastopirellula marina TaxID=124 RepID=A0A2S8FX06_9BACT|nr:hypothetical protein C5Y98_11925 [Blastopirellula marina]PTL44523.1 hypothetical protein C5Y97_11935 [Blastopirellula marina]